MDFQTYQRKLAGLIRGNYTPRADDDVHIKRIAESENLEVTKEIVLWWRQLSLERYCILTSKALKQLGIFDEETKRFVEQGRFSPFIEELAEKFLATLANHEIEVVASLARFEMALIKAKLGAIEAGSIEWCHDPYAVLDALLNEGDLRKLECAGKFTTLVSADLPSLFRVMSEQEIATTGIH